MESSPIAPRPPEPAVPKTRETGERQPGRRRFDEEQRNAFRRALADEESETRDTELQLSPEARNVESRRDAKPARETDAGDSVHDVRGRRLDIRI